PEVFCAQAARSAAVPSRLGDLASKTDGMILVTEPLPSPDRTNRATNPATSTAGTGPENPFAEPSAIVDATATTTAATIIATKVTTVTLLPPIRSASLPP